MGRSNDYSFQTYWQYNTIHTEWLLLMFIIDSPIHEGLVWYFTDF